MGHDGIDFQAGELGCEVRKALEFPVRKAPLDDQVPSLDMTELAQSCTNAS